MHLLHLLVLVLTTSLSRQQESAVTMVPTDDATTPNPLECYTKQEIPPDENTAVGITEAVPNSWPWLVSIRLNGRHNCSGAVYGTNLVVTAARCLYSSDPASYAVVAGSHCLQCTYENNEQQQQRQVVQMQSHPLYSSATLENDVALLMVDQPFEFNSRVIAACVANVPTSDYEKCFIAGWGSSWKPTENIFQAMLPIVPMSVCRDESHYGSTQSWYPWKVTDRMLCAGYDQGGINACADDFGSPLMCKSGDGEWFLHGISSGGDSCDKQGRPIVFTRAAEYRQWLWQTAVDMMSSD